MTITPTPLAGCIVLTPRVFNDERGHFFESFNERTFNDAVGYDVNFVQDNQSFSTKGVLRGLHLQKGEHAQSKLVRVTQGEVQDIAVDLRKNSPTYGQYVSVILSAQNNQQLFIPKGFGHGFLVLSPSAIFQYKCDNYYNKESEGGLHYADPSVNIKWELDESELVVSVQDVELPFLKDAGDFGF
jgi:dTDP-4-dehydrorhamnose 3,5-epimerase